jgi:hypothetical protein
MKAERRAAAAGLRPQQQAPEAKAGVGLVFKVRLCCAGPHAISALPLSCGVMRLRLRLQLNRSPDTLARVLRLRALSLAML